MKTDGGEKISPDCESDKTKPNSNVIAVPSANSPVNVSLTFSDRW